MKPRFDRKHCGASEIASVANASPVHDFVAGVELCPEKPDSAHGLQEFFVSKKPGAGRISRLMAVVWSSSVALFWLHSWPCPMHLHHHLRRDFRDELHSDGNNAPVLQQRTVCLHKLGLALGCILMAFRRRNGLVLPENESRPLGTTENGIGATLTVFFITYILVGMISTTQAESRHHKREIGRNSVSKGE